MPWVFQAEKTTTDNDISDNCPYIFVKKLFSTKLDTLILCSKRLVGAFFVANVGLD